MSTGVLAQTLDNSNINTNLNVTQLVKLDTTQVNLTEGPAAKRLRLGSAEEERSSLDTTFRALFDKIQAPAENDLTKIPWIQLLTNLLARFPGRFQAGLRIQVLRVLSNLLQATR